MVKSFDFFNIIVKLERQVKETQASQEQVYEQEEDCWLVKSRSKSAQPPPCC
jgi:hypothetical protein